MLAERQHGAPPQVAALDGSEALVTITIGGNDVGYVPLLMAASLPRVARRLPLLGGRIADLLDRDDARPSPRRRLRLAVRGGYVHMRQRAPHARVFFVDYLTVLPPAGAPAPPLSADVADLGRHVAATLERLTAEAAAATGCEVVRAAEASRQHHAWSADPWTTSREPVCRCRAGPPRCTRMAPGCARWRS